MPTFDGTTIRWKSFCNLFSSNIERELDLSDADKSCLLLNAFVNPESKSLAQGAIGCPKTFDEALVIIREHYENNRILFRHHYESFHQAEHFSCKVEDTVKFKTKITTAARGMEEAKDFTTGHMMVEAAMDMLEKHLMLIWMEFTHKLKDPPDLDTFLSFLDYLRTIIPLSRHTLAPPERPVRHKQQTPKKAALKLQESYTSKGTHKISCILCNADHLLFACTDFKALSVQERWTNVKQHRLFFNCLSKGHGSNSCPSKVRCRICNKLHHTMLHNETNNAECSSPAPSVTATASAERSTATASADRPSASASDTSVSLACLPASGSKVLRIPLTALAVAFSGSHECRYQIQMDTGSMLSLVTTKPCSPVAWCFKDSQHCSNYQWSGW